MFWIFLLIYAGTTVLSGLLAKTPKVTASGLGDLQVPTAEDGRSLPFFWGTCCLKSPNVVWYGDYKCQAIKKSKGWLSFGATYTAGYKYYLGMDLALCHGPVDALVDILAGSGDDYKQLKWQGGENINKVWWLGPILSPAPSQQPDGSIAVYVASGNIFGGDEKEGGISGFGAFYPGNANQNSDAYMSQKLALVYPNYAGVCHFVCKQWYWGTTQYIKNVAFVMRRCPSNLGLDASETNINGDANPAEMIYECLANKAFGLGFPVERVDVSSFQAAGSTLAAEGFGMSMLVDTPKQADQLIETILQHIDGVCYQDPSTGLWTLKLVRPDYDPAALPEYGPDEIAECEYSRGSWEDTVNQVKVTYVNRATWKASTVQAQETANFAIRNGELESKTFDFSGFSNQATAQKACNRELRANSYPMGKGRIKVNRKAWQLRMGSPFLLTWPARGISRMPVRVTSIDYGSLKDGMMEMEFCEDIFKANYTAFNPPGDSGWINPITDPLPVASQMMFEAPFQMLDGAAQPRTMIAAVRADSVSQGYLVMSRETLADDYRQQNDVAHFTPGAQLGGAYSRKTAALDTVGFDLTGTDLDELVSTDEAGRDRGENLLMFADTGEICAFQTVLDNGDGSFRIKDIVRGVYDTFPADHPAGTWVYFISYGAQDAAGDYEAEGLADSGDDSIILND